MSVAAACADRWRERIARARVLAAEDAPASTLLTFYTRLAEHQLELACRVPSKLAARFADAIDLDHLASSVPPFLNWLRAAAPAPLANAAATLTHTPAEWSLLVRERLQADGDGDEPDGDARPTDNDPDPGIGQVVVARFAIDAVLQPYAEIAALSVGVGQPTGQPFGGLSARCPVCASAPSVGVLREDGHGARRTLVCARCMTEWPYRRVVCTGCGEEEFDKLPVYTAETLPHVRVEACDRCRRYLKTVDLSKNGLAVPIVDDVASVSLDLWAREAGYRRARRNVLRL
jgi:formate dehydrogenase maturation protein FdhE